MKIARFFLAPLIAISGTVIAQSPLDKPVIDDGVRKIYDTERKANVKTYLGNQDVLVRTGLVADRKSREVRIVAYSTGNTKDLPLEYVLVGEKGKDYESLAVTAAKASDVHAAMEFVGMTAGHPIRREIFQLWSKGDPVEITVSWTENGKVKSFKAHELLNYPAAKEIIESGWIFTGSFVAENNGRKVYAADDAGDMISTFNSPWTVFDLAAGAGQKEIYGNVTPSDKFTAKHQHRMEIVIKPTLGVGESRNMEFTLDVVPQKPGATVASGDDLRFTLGDPKTKKAIVEAGRLKAVLQELSKVVKRKKLAYAELRYDQSIPLSAMGELVQVLHHVTDSGLVRIEPVKGQIFYQAFTPKADWRDPESRPGQPLEFFLPEKTGDPIRFRYYDEDYLETGEVKLSEMKRTFKTDDELATILKIKKDWITQAVLFYGTPNTPLKDIQRLYTLLSDKYPIAFVFIDKK